MEKPTYNAQYFIDKFEAIPEDKWCMGTYTEGEKHCAFGHCGMRLGSIGLNKEADALFDMLPKVVDINDNRDNQYPRLGSTPKQRIINALKALSNEN